MQLGLIALSLTDGAALLARAALMVVLVCCLADPVVKRMWSLRVRHGPENTVDLNAMWQHD